MSRTDKSNLVLGGEITTLVDPLDLHSKLKKKDAEIQSGKLVIKSSSQDNTPLDVGWLKFASKPYQISANISDYVMIPVPAFYADVPNRNGVGFMLSDLVAFNPDQGRLAYKTWKGKPVLYEHSDPNNLSTSKGVILDTAMRPHDEHWKMLAYVAVDRTKDKVLAERLLTKDVSTYSIGAFAKKFECSACGKTVGQCTHLDSRSPNFKYGLLGSTINRHEKRSLVYAIGRQPEGFEISVVENPAFPMAGNDKLHLPV